MKTRFKFLLLLLIVQTGFAQNKQSKFFTKDKLFPTLIIDPTEKLFYVSGVKNFNYDKNSTTNTFNYDYFIPFALTYYRSIYSNNNHQFSAEAGAHTEFGIRDENNIYFSGQRRSYLNSDFLLEFDYSLKINEHLLLKAGLMHRSTHLGDDYILLQGTSPKNYWKNDPSNYQILKAALLYKFKSINVYSRLGYVLDGDSPRKKFEFQIGFYASRISDKGILKNLIFGMDMKMLENNNYNPSMKTAVGIKPVKEACIMLEFYNGNFPYSRFEADLKIQWLGVGLYLTPYDP